MSDRTGASEALQLALIIAHQLKSPIASLATVLQLLLSGVGGPLTPKQREMLEKAFSRCSESVAAAQRLLAITRALERPETLAGRVHVGNLLRQTLIRYGERAAERQIELSGAIEPDVEWAAADPDALAEVLDALFDNALKYTPHHGRIRLSAAIVSLPAAGEEELPAEAVRIAIADSGAGVPEAERGKVFEPFFRSSTARKGAYQGTGLGLAFVKAVVEAAGGSVALARSEWGGAEFIVTLPRLPAQDTAAEQPQRAPRRRIVIIGGVAAGPKVAAKLMRLMPDAEVTIVEKGRLLAYAGCGLPFYISGRVRNQEQLMSSPIGGVRDPVFFQKVKNVRIMNQTEAIEIDRAGKAVRVRSRAGGKEAVLPYDYAVLATGSIPILPQAPGLELRNIFRLHGVQDAEGIKAELDGGKARDVVIVGGGLIGLEMTEALVRKGCRVTLVERRDQILPLFDWEMAKLVERHLEAHGIRVLTRARLERFEGTGGLVRAVRTDRGVFAADTVIVAMGVRPNVELAAKAGLELGPTGALKVSSGMMTSDPAIYAAGDCVESVSMVSGQPVYAPFGSNANHQGRVAAVNIAGGKESYPGVLQSVACEVFGWVAARTGLSEAEAAALGVGTTCALVSQADAEHFVLPARAIMMKLVVETATRRLLGVQAIGPGRADKRVDAAALAVMNKMTVDQVANADLCYTPQLSAVMDILITAANVARNKLDGEMRGVAPAELKRRLDQQENLTILDVRAPFEVEQGTLPGAQRIPLGILRERLGELSKERPVVTFCSSSLRGYEAALILKAAGFQDVRVLDGGLEMWPYERA